MPRKPNRDVKAAAVEGKTPTTASLSAERAGSRKRSLPLDNPSITHGMTKRQKKGPAESPPDDSALIDRAKPAFSAKRPIVISKDQATTHHTLKETEKPEQSAQSRPNTTIDRDELTIPSSSNFLSGEPSADNDSRLPAEVHHLISKYNFMSKSILSSTKMRQKIPLILEHIGHFSFSDPSAKPGIVILYSKADVASKMISIVEIIKKEVEKVKGKWWQYSKLQSRLEGVKPKNQGSGRTLRDLGVDDKHSSALNDSLKPAITKSSEGRERGEVVDVDEEDEVEAAFETMALPRRPETREQPRKVRNVPIMTIYIARVPVPGLKELYGYVNVPTLRKRPGLIRAFSEQTNA